MIPITPTTTSQTLDGAFRSRLMRAGAQRAPANSSGDCFLIPAFARVRTGLLLSLLFLGVLTSWLRPARTPPLLVAPVVLGFALAVSEGLCVSSVFD